MVGFDIKEFWAGEWLFSPINLKQVNHGEMEPKSYTFETGSLKPSWKDPQVGGFWKWSWHPRARLISSQVPSAGGWKPCLASDGHRFLCLPPLCTIWAVHLWTRTNPSLLGNGREEKCPGPGSSKVFPFTGKWVLGQTQRNVHQQVRWLSGWGLKCAWLRWHHPASQKLS